MQRRTLVILLLVFVGLRVVLGLLPGYPPDLETFKRWAVWGALNGVHTVYDKGSNFDYPPLYAFILTPFGAIEEELRPSYARQFLHIPRDRVTRIDYSPVFSLLVKIPPLLFDLLMAAVVALLVHRYGLWRWSRDWGGWLPASMILFHPAILYVSGYMGQPDSVHTSLILLALTLILLRRPELGWVAAALACMTKPLAAPYLPLLALVTVMRMGFKRSCTAALASWATLALVFTPFMLTGRTETAFQRIFGDWDLLPLTSVNGHNLWWLVGGWQSADEPMLGFLTPRTIGLTLFGASCIGILGWVWHAERARHAGAAPEPQPGGLYEDRHWYLAVAGIAFSFFTFSTHMHENHLFLVIPLLVLFAGWGRKWAWLYAVVAISILTNLVTHDLYIGEHLLSKFGGTTDFVAPTVVWYKGIEGNITRPSHLSGLEFGLSIINSVVTLGCWATFMWWMIRSTSEPEADAPVPGP